MKKITKLISFAAAGIMALQATAFADFSDMPDGEIGASLQKAVSNGLITGYEDGTVRPNDNITRAQMAAIIVRAMGAKDNSNQAFPDVAADAWYNDAVSKAVKMGAFKGDTDGNFNPENNISCQETYTVLSRVFQFESYALNYSDGSVKYATKADPSCLNSFADSSSVASWATDYAAAIVGNGGFTGFNGQLKGDSYITRGEFAYLMDSLIGTYIDEPGTYLEGTIDGSKSVVVRTGGVVLDGFHGQRNLIIAYSADERGVMIKNSSVALVLAVMGCADPNKNFNNLKSYISVGAAKADDFKDIRVCAPYIYLDASGAMMTKNGFLKGYSDNSGVPKSKINLGMVGG